MGSRNPERVRLSCENIMLQLLLLATNIKIVYSRVQEQFLSLQSQSETVSVIVEAWNAESSNDQPTGIPPMFVFYLNTNFF